MAVLGPQRYFHDITGIGPKQSPATSNGLFPTTPGFDLATGFGTPNMADHRQPLKPAGP